MIILTLTYRNVRNIAKLNEQELKYGIFDHRKSWHSQYKDSAYIFIGILVFVFVLFEVVEFTSHTQ